MAVNLSAMALPSFMDAVDRALLDLLQEEGKSSLAKLGETVGLGAPAVLERLRKLESAGIITGYSATLDGKRLGLDITAFVGVSINYPKDISAFLAKVTTRPEVLECHHVTGSHTLLLKVKTENTASLERVISALREVEGVTRTETMIVLSTAAETSKLPLPPVATDNAPPKRRTGRALREAD